jgi:tetratricopeptide (TPR) repeat protein
LNRTLELAPQFYEAYFRRATTKKKLGQLDSALQDLDKVLASGGDKTRSKGLFERAKILHMQKDYSAALNDYNLVAHAEPTNPEVFYQR